MYVANGNGSTVYHPPLMTSRPPSRPDLRRSRCRQPDTIFLSSRTHTTPSHGSLRRAPPAQPVEVQKEHQRRLLQKQDQYFFPNPKAPIVSLLGPRTAQRHLPSPDMAQRPPQHPSSSKGTHHPYPHSASPRRLYSPLLHPVDMDILPANPFASPIVELRRP